MKLKNNMSQEKTKFSAKLNQFQQRELVKILEVTMNEKRIDLTSTLDKNVEEATQTFLKKQKRAQKLVQTIANSWKELNALLKGTYMDTEHDSGENIELTYKGYSYNIGDKEAPEIKKVKIERDTKLAKLEKIKTSLKMRIIVGDITYDEMSKMIAEELATL